MPASEVQDPIINSPYKEPAVIANTMKTLAFFSARFPYIKVLDKK